MSMKEGFQLKSQRPENAHRERFPDAEGGHLSDHEREGLQEYLAEILG